MLAVQHAELVNGGKLQGIERGNRAAPGREQRRRKTGCGETGNVRHDCRARPLRENACVALAGNEHRPGYVAFYAAAQGGMLRASDLQRRCRYARGDMIEKTVKRNLSPVDDLLRALKGFEQIIGQEAMAETAMLIGGFGCAGGSEDYAPFSRKVGKARLRGAHVPRLGLDLQHLRAEATREAAVQEEHQPFGGDAGKPLLNQVERDRGIRKIRAQRVMRDQLVRLRAVAGESDNNYVVRPARGEGLEFLFDPRACRVVVGQEHRRAAQRIGEQGLKRDGVTARATELANVGEA
ncbi:MAG: hypothetical protein QOI12_4393 [Alphaproteobacteria bacterium]|nr:hypothetical protein [Alphaproteobacteria bacterium]